MRFGMESLSGYIWLMLLLLGNKFSLGCLMRLLLDTSLALL
ncbi:unnamed protein product [Arabidopsis halleri]